MIGQFKKTWRMYLGIPLVLLAIITVFLTFNGCVSPLTCVEIPNLKEHDNHVVIVKSSDNPFYRKPIASFVEQIEANVTIVEISNSASHRSIADAITALKPDLVYSLGIEATQIVYNELTVPTLFAMVPHHRERNLLPNARFFGITLESPPMHEFAQFKLIIPNMKRVLVFYDPEISPQTIRTAETNLKTMGITLQAVEVHNVEDLKRAYHEHAKTVDAIWLQIDPVVMNTQSFSFLVEQATNHKLPLVTSLSDKLAESGATVSVSADFEAIGSQAANLATLYLEEKTVPQEQRIQTPLGWRLTLNLTAANLISMKIPEESLPYVSRIVSADYTE